MSNLTPNTAPPDPSQPPMARAGFNPELVIRAIPPYITTFSVPFTRGGVLPIGGRSTAIKLKDDSLWILASHPLCEQTMKTLQDLGGNVRHIVSPDLEHNMYLKQYSDAFPEAKLYAPATIANQWKKAKKGVVHHVYGKGETCPFEEATGGEMKSCDFGKAFVNEDIAFLHVPSKTLIEADLLFNLPPTEQYSKSQQKPSVAILTKRMTPGSSFQKNILWYMLAKNKPGMSKGAKEVAEWDFDRIIPCHGDVIETGGKKAWTDSYADFLTGRSHHKPS